MSDLALLQQQIGAQPTDTWDPATAQAVVNFQSQRGIFPTGDVDPATLVAAGVYTPTGRTGSAFWRDIMASMNQVPRWAWFGVAGLSFGLAYLSYRRKNPKAGALARRRRR